MDNRRYSRSKKPAKRNKTLAGLVMMAALTAGIRPALAGVPDWLRAAAQASLPKYPEDTNAVVLLNEQITTVKDSGEIRTLYRRAYKILRPEGRDLGVVAVYFNKETRLTYLKAWSIPSSGKDYEVKEKDAIETSAFGEALYQDARHKLLKIPAAEPGNVIGYEYEQKRRPAILQDTWVFQEDIPVRRARFELELPSGWEFESFWENHPALKPVETRGSKWVWELEEIPAVENEPSMPPRRAVEGRLAVTYFPRRPELGGKSLASWKDVGVWYARLTEGRRRSTPEIRQKAIELTSSSPGVFEKIKALAAFAQKDIRYVAIEIGIGDYQPHPAQDIFTNRYGDCKDKATLLSTMLGEIGVKSYYVLVHTDRGIVVPEFPSALVFNHVILAIASPPDAPPGRLFAALEHPRLGRLLFFDPTHPFVPVGYLPSSLQANNGLLVTEAGGELVKLPLLPPTANRLLRSAKLALTPSGTLYGDVQEIRWGFPADELRSQLLSASEADRKKVLENFLGGFLGSFVLQGSQVENLDKFDSNLLVHYGFVARDYAQTAGDLLLVRPRVLGQKSENLLEKKERKYPVEFPASTLQSDIVEIALPAGYKVDELPPPVEVDTGVALYRSKTEVAESVLKYVRNYQIKEVLIPTSRLGELKQFFRQVAADEHSSAVLKRSTP